MIPVFGIVILPQNPSTENGQISGWSCIPSVVPSQVRDPANPEFVGCYSADGYTHDAECVVYRGPSLPHCGTLDRGLSPVLRGAYQRFASLFALNTNL